MRSLQTRVFSAGASGALSLMLAACTVGPDYTAPEVVVPESWGALSAEAGAAAGPEPAASSVATAAPAALASWWTTFDDPLLDSLIARAVRANPGLREAQARVREARARRGVVAADLFPSVDAGGSYSRDRSSGNVDGPFGGPAMESDLYQAGFDAAWEIDVFGGVRRGIEAADADISASVEDRRDVLVTLLAEVAQRYVELRGLQRRIEIARANLGAQRETLAMTRARFDAGLVGDLDVARAEAQVRTTQAEIPAIESAARQSIHALSVLLAQPPAALLEELSTADALPTPPAEVPVGLPSDLLRRRPDIRRAERGLAGATARIGVATADLFPRFTLTGAWGVQSSELGSAGDAESVFWSFGPGVSWRVLDFGRIRSNIGVQNAREEQALAAYERSILTGLREVEDSLVAFEREQARREALSGAVEADRRAARLARNLYEQGLSDFLSVLQAERDLFASEDALVLSELAVSTNLVRLYKSLGGGWEVEAAAGPAGAGYGVVIPARRD
jgi:NodT family efflux transporter outer membrane factor (OMF) lipoprotein